MATKTIVSVLDDFDGTEGAETVTFSFDGVNYEIDLAKANRARMTKALTPFIDHARKVGRAGGATRRPPRSAPQRDTRAIREWAQANSVEVGEKGRIPAAVIEQYEAAQQNGTGRRKAATAAK